MYYWATISRRIKPVNSGVNYLYRVVYHDGDTATVDASKMHSHAEALKLMEKGKILENLPSPGWLEQVTRRPSQCSPDVAESKTNT